MQCANFSFSLLLHLDTSEASEGWRLEANSHYQLSLISYSKYLNRNSMKFEEDLFLMENKQRKYQGGRVGYIKTNKKTAPRGFYSRKS